MPTDKYTAIVDVNDECEIQAYGWNELTKNLKKHPGKRFYITATTKRSLSQNNTYWWWLDLLAEHVGETDKETLSNDIKAHLGFWDEYVQQETGEVFKILKSTADASVAEMKIYMEKVQIFVQQFYNFVLPDPDSQMKIRM